MSAQIIQPKDLQDISRLLFSKDGFLQVKPYSEIMSHGRDTVLYFCYVNGIYCLPTTELISFIKDNILGSAIEIGCGHGAIGRSIGIPITDICLQEQPEIMKYYDSTNQPVINYPKDVIRLSAELAMNKYNPGTVIAAYVTHKYNGKSGSIFGVVEGKIIRSARYIFIGNECVHSEKPILHHVHETYKFPWIISRSDPKRNFIKIWN